MKKTTLIETAIFPAEKKTEKHPDYTRTIENLQGKLSIALWEQTSKEGKKYFNLQISRIENEIPTTTNS
jgi:uncharacterized protein (DUF736 family)